MSSNAIEAQGVVLAVSISSVMTTIPEIKSFQGPGGAAAVIDVTDLGSSAKEKRMGLPDEGQLTANINYIPDDTVHAYLVAQRKARTLESFKITFTDAAPAITWTFSAYITGFSTSVAVDGVVEASVTLEISGSITEA